MTNSFTFVGKICKPKENFYEERSFPSGWVKRSVKFAMLCGNSIQYITVQGGKWADDTKNIVKTFSKARPGESGQNIDIPWNQRTDPTVMEGVAKFKKFSIDATDPGSDVKRCREFLSEWDFIENIKNMLSSDFITDRIFEVKGEITFNYSVDKSQHYRNFEARTISVADPSTEQKSEGHAEIFYTREMLEMPSSPSENTAILNAHMRYYDRSAKKNFFVPVALSIHKDENFGSGMLEIIKNIENRNAEKVMRSVVVLDFINGSNKVAPTWEMIEPTLTKNQRDFLARGMVSKEQILAEAPDMVDETVTKETKITGFGKGGSNGLYDTEYTKEDLYTRPDSTYAPAAKKADSNAIKDDFFGNSVSKSTKPATNKVEQPDDDIDNIFDDVNDI